MVVKLVTLSDIARTLGVSVATVSNALTGKGRMRPDLRDSIIKHAIASGYPVIENAASAGTQKLYVIVEDINVIFCGDIVEGLSEYASKTNTVFTLCNLGVIIKGLGLKPDMKTLHKMLMESLTDMPPYTTGIIYISQYPRNVDKLFAGVFLPVVYAYCSVTDGAPCINYNDRQGAYIATQYLLKRGARRIAMLCGPIDSLSMSNRVFGYQRALVERNITVDPRLTMIGDWSVESGRQIGRALMQLPNKPDAIFAQNDNMAIGVLETLTENGLRIPEDILLIGFDDLPDCRWMRPTLSSIRPPLREIGMEAVRQMQNLLSPHPSENEQKEIFLPCTVMERETTARV